MAIPDRYEFSPCHYLKNLLNIFLAFQILFALIIFALCPFLPDSPRLLIRKGRYEEALEIIAALEGHGATVSSPTVQGQFQIIKDVLDREHASEYTWKQLLSGHGTSLSSIVS